MTNNQNYLAFLEDLATVLEAEPTELVDSFELHNEIWNSLSIVSTIVLLDEHFGISIPGENLRLCTSIGELWQLIRTALKEKEK